MTTTGETTPSFPDATLGGLDEALLSALGSAEDVGLPEIVRRQHFARATALDRAIVLGTGRRIAHPARLVPQCTVSLGWAVAPWPFPDPTCGGLDEEVLTALAMASIEPDEATRLSLIAYAVTLRTAIMTLTGREVATAHHRNRASGQM